MATLFAIDGCPAGWLILSSGPKPESIPGACIVRVMADLNGMLRDGDIVAIDMPIGLKDANEANHARRECDQAARGALGTRSCCVFYTPARGVLDHIATYSGASSWHKAHTGKGLSCQVYNILNKVRELDDWLREDSKRAGTVHEVHPELSFAHWADGEGKAKPISERKKTRAGREKRRSLVEKQWPGAFASATCSLGPKAARGLKPLNRWQDDDLLDAFAALWTLQRISRHEAIPYPADAPKDSCGQSMCIWA